MAVPIVLSPNLTYATKVNIKFPGTQAQATAAEAAAVTRAADSLPTGVALTVAGGTIKLAL
jgi:hypothetical protein